MIRIERKIGELKKCKSTFFFFTLTLFHPLQCKLIKILNKHAFPNLIIIITVSNKNVKQATPGTSHVLKRLMGMDLFKVAFCSKNSIVQWNNYNMSLTLFDFISTRSSQLSFKVPVPLVCTAISW